MDRLEQTARPYVLLQNTLLVTGSTHRKPSATVPFLAACVSWQVAGLVATKQPGVACGPPGVMRSQLRPLSWLRTSAHSQSAAENHTLPLFVTPIVVSPV